MDPQRAPKAPQSEASSPSPLQDGKPYGKHAVWIGNIPETLTTEELEQIFEGFGFVSAFVVMKHKCAFVNFDDWDECTRSIASLNGKDYRGRKLAVRLRNPKEKKLRLAAQAQSVRPNGVSLPSPTPKITVEVPRNIPMPRSTRHQESGSSSSSSSAPRLYDDLKRTDSAPSEEKIPARYFVMKTQSQQDLELAVTRGFWASSTRNEVLLDEAFLSSEVVYLVFSVNQSGEFFGLAKMMTPTGADEGEISWAIVAQPSSPKEPAQPDITTAPQDDNVAEGSAEPNAAAESSEPAASETKAPETQDEQSQRFPSYWAHPFGIQWLSLKRLPFTQTKHLHNSWNENKEVKVSRDGTELEPTVGQQLVQLFLDPSSASPDSTPRSSSPPSLSEGSSPSGTRFPPKASPSGPRRIPRAHEFSPDGAIPGAYSPYVAPPFPGAGYPYTRPFIQYYPYPGSPQGAPNMKVPQQYPAGGFYHNGLFVANSNFAYPYVQPRFYNMAPPVYPFYGQQQYPAPWKGPAANNNHEEQSGEGNPKAERNAEAKGTEAAKETANQQIEQAA